MLKQVILGGHGEGAAAKVEVMLQHSLQLAHMKDTEFYDRMLLHHAAEAQSGPSGARIVQLLHQANPQAALTADTDTGGLPLHIAAQFQGGERGTEVVEALLRAEAKAALVGNEDGLTPLHVAVEHQGGAKGTAVVEVLLKAEPKAARMGTVAGDLPLHTAAYSQEGERSACHLATNRFVLFPLRRRWRKGRCCGGAAAAGLPRGC